MSDQTFTVLWIAALIAIVVFYVFYWIESLFLVAFGLWYWVMALKQR